MKPTQYLGLFLLALSIGLVAYHLHKAGALSIIAKGVSVGIGTMAFLYVVLQLIAGNPLL